MSKELPSPCIHSSSCTWYFRTIVCHHCRKNSATSLSGLRSCTISVNAVYQSFQGGTTSTHLLAECKSLRYSTDWASLMNNLLIGQLSLNRLKELMIWSKIVFTRLFPKVTVNNLSLMRSIVQNSTRMSIWTPFSKRYGTMGAQSLKEVVSATLFLDLYFSIKAYTGLKSGHPWSLRMPKKDLSIATQSSSG